jgi:hypothetical protein
MIFKNMLLRDIDGKLIIISRKDCKNEKVYNEKIYNVRLPYTKTYKSIFLIDPKVVLSNKSNVKVQSKDLSDD